MKKSTLLFVCLAAVALYGCGSKEDVDTPAFNACSNNSDVLNLPFKYDIESETDRILLESSGDPSQNVYVHFAPFGAHFEPMTSHAYGDNKVNFFGFFSESDAQIPDLAGGQSGFNGGLGAVNLHNLRPIYTSPGNGRITSINYVGPADGTYLDNQYWTITLKYNDFEIKLDHIGKLSSAVHDFLEEQFGFNSYAYSPNPSDYGNILPDLGQSHLTVAVHTPVGYPQVRASLVPGQSEDIWYNGVGSVFEDRPSIKIEYSVSAPTANGNNDVCLFELLSTARKEKFQAILENDLTNYSEDDIGGSQFYRTFTDTAWQWRAESSVCLSCSTKTNDLNGLYKNLGGWFEADGNTTAKDELISFIPIATDSPIGYDATLYNNKGLNATEWLILRRNFAALFTWQMQDMSIIAANYPAGEIITIEDDALEVEWRDLEVAASGTSAFQWLCYDITDSVLTIKFGELKDSRAPREVVLDLAVDTPDGVEVIAYVKDKISGF